VPNVALDILVNVVKTKMLLIFISLSSLVFIFVLVLVSSTIIQSVFVIFVIVFVVVDEKNTAAHSVGWVGRLLRQVTVAGICRRL